MLSTYLHFFPLGILQNALYWKHIHEKICSHEILCSLWMACVMHMCALLACFAHLFLYFSFVFDLYDELWKWKWQVGQKKKSHSFHHTETSSFKKKWVLEKKLNCSTVRSLKQHYCCLEKELHKHQVVDSIAEFQGGGDEYEKVNEFFFFLWFKKRKKREHTNQRTTFYKENFDLPCTNGSR